MTTANQARFNEEAASWDANPDVQRATALAHAAYLSRLPPPPTLSTYDVLDLGCGTGLLSLALAPSVRSVTAVDPAQGMIDALRAKLLPPPPSPSPPAGRNGAVFQNVRGVCALLEDPDDERLCVDPVTGQAERGRRFDLVVSHLVLHHIPDLERLFRTIYGVLKKGGRAMVTDFEHFGPDARRFHPEAKMEGVERHGIEAGHMKRVLEAAGFVEVKVERAFEMAKKVETEPGSGVLGPEMLFPFLICEGRRE
ncbi:Malonyl-[acyl-carrier protein] O-methyltransferase [Madurella mycetomatis]|uniref:Malonyl-[acyl-carrier protein] O-methyltransferase n=1 Tax=Madurella mycetomatis TaxID=100816 RepID=A0A175VRR8_9PEZI|nr:Malonyl-[acyl-carrier protein] O-methyltransferase [Madurella mycetomatis]KXX78388.1 Malonyl-[acyl-carrier protein] O-methyltransferase [Madurella mycetomatis]